MTMKHAGSQTAVKPVAKAAPKSGRNLLRKLLGYTAIAVGVTVGGVLIGAIVIAPAVSRAKPLFARASQQANTQESEGTGGAVGQADGDPMLAAAAAAAESFKPMAEVIASAAAIEAKASMKPRRTGWAAFKYQVADRFDDVRLAAGRVPKILWVYADIGAVLLMAGVWFYRRRRNVTHETANSLSLNNLDRRSAAHLPVKLIPGKSSRTPKAVAALAEAGSSPADIARRTGLPLDAVAMLISMGSFGARQLQPPTA